MKNARPTEVEPSAIKESAHDIDPAEILQNAPSKISRILAGLLVLDSMNTPESRRFGESCLNSTVSRLSNKYGLVIERQLEEVPTNWGPEPTRFTRYRIAESERDKALALLSHLVSRGKREVAE